VFRVRTAENVAIFVALQWVNRVLGVVTKIVLIRLLMPDVFGVFALAAGLIGFIGTFGGFGLDYAIIRKGDRVAEADYNAGMSLRLVIALGLFVASIVVAGPWASLFSLPSVASASQVLAIVYLVGPFSFVPSTRLSAELRYRAIAVPSLAGQISNSVISVALATLGFQLWSLVYGLVISQVIATVAFSVMEPWTFRFMLNREVVRPLLAYAKHLVSASFLAFLITNIDNFTVGFFLGSTALGFYAVAYGIGYLPVSLLSTPAGSALFPSLVKIQDQTETLRRGYLESLGYAASLIAPAGIGVIVLAPELVSVILGPVWIPATVPLVFLALYGLFRAIIDFSSSLFAAVGKPRLISVLNLYILIGSSALLVPLTLTYGISGTAVAVTVPVAAVSVLAIYQAANTLGSGFGELASRVRGPLLSAELMGVLVWGCRTVTYRVLPSQVSLPFGETTSAATIVLLIALPIGALVYFGFLRLIDPTGFRGIGRNALLAIRAHR